MMPAGEREETPAGGHSLVPLIDHLLAQGVERPPQEWNAYRIDTLLIPPGTLCYVHAASGTVWLAQGSPQLRWLHDMELDAWAATVEEYGESFEDRVLRTSGRSGAGTAGPRVPGQRRARAHDQGLGAVPQDGASCPRQEQPRQYGEPHGEPAHDPYEPAREGSTYWRYHGRYRAAFLAGRAERERRFFGVDDEDRE